MATGFKDGPLAQGTTSRPAPGRTRTTSLLVGGAIVVAAIAALFAFGRPAQRDVSATASAPVTTSPPTDHPAVTQPVRPSPLPTQLPPK